MRHTVGYVGGALHSHSATIALWEDDDKEVDITLSRFSGSEVIPVVADIVADVISEVEELVFCALNDPDFVLEVVQMNPFVFNAVRDYFYAVPKVEV